MRGQALALSPQRHPREWRRLCRPSLSMLSAATPRGATSQLEAQPEPDRGRGARATRAAAKGASASRRVGLERASSGRSGGAADIELARASFTFVAGAAGSAIRETGGPDAIVTVLPTPALTSRKPVAR